MSEVRLGDPHIYTDVDGNERCMYVTVNRDRRTGPWRRMKKDMAEQAALKSKKDEMK